MVEGGDEGDNCVVPFLKFPSCGSVARTPKVPMAPCV